jgi:hypothetical protein
MDKGRGRSPTPQSATARQAPGDSSPGLRAAARIETSGRVWPRVGFFAKALSGKTRPSVREPRVSHYMCHDDDCRWTA